LPSFIYLAFVSCSATGLTGSTVNTFTALLLHTAILPAVPAPVARKMYFELPTFEMEIGGNDLKNKRHMRFSRQ
jgi:hypothetical protein